MITARDGGDNVPRTLRRRCGHRSSISRLLGPAAFPSSPARARLSGMFTLLELDAAADLVHAAFSPTPTYSWPLINARVGTEVWVKHENHTPTGAFKVRGGLTYFHRLSKNGRPPRGVISATRG